MRIAFLADAANRHTHRWATRMTQTGHEIAVFSDRPPPDEMDYGSIPIFEPEWTLWRNLVTYKLRGGTYANNRDKWRAYQNRITIWRPDILHAHEALAYGPMLTHFPQYARVLTPWGTDMQSLREEDPERRKLVHRAVHAAGVVSTNAPGFESEWAGLANVGTEKFRLFSWGVDRSVFHVEIRADPSLLERLSIPAGKPFLLSPRRATPLFGIETILEAWDSLDLQEANLIVLRAGAEEKHWTRIVELAREKEIRSLHLVDDYLTPGEMASLYAASHGVIMIPERDLLAMSFLEALACGALVVAAPNPAYDLAFTDFRIPRQDRAWGIELPDRSLNALRESMRLCLALEERTRVSLREQNTVYIVLHHDWEKQSSLMNEVYELAIERHAGESSR